MPLCEIAISEKLFTSEVGTLRSFWKIWLNIFWWLGACKPAMSLGRICSRCRTLKRECTCTGYAKKRHSLRHHRVEMNVMMELITENDLADAYDDLVVDRTGNTGFYLGYISDMDCPSEHDYDPEAIATDAVAKLQLIVDEKEDMGRFVEAAAAIAENNGLRLALERARMQLEDCRAQLRRASCEPTSHKRQRDAKRPRRRSPGSRRSRRSAGRSA
jgi:hypothetical protein